MGRCRFDGSWVGIVRIEIDGDFLSREADVLGGEIGHPGFATDEEEPTEMFRMSVAVWRRLRVRGLVRASLAPQFDRDMRSSADPGFPRANPERTHGEGSGFKV